MLENIRLEWKLLINTNTLDYYGAQLITTVKGFIVKATGRIVLSYFLLRKCQIENQMGDTKTAWTILKQPN